MADDGPETDWDTGMRAVKDTQIQWWWDKSDKDRGLFVLLTDLMPVTITNKHGGSVTVRLHNGTPTARQAVKTLLRYTFGK